MAVKIQTEEVETRLVENLKASNVRIIDISGGCGNLPLGSCSALPCQLGTAACNMPISLAMVVWHILIRFNTSAR